jgi:hypothetical protein
MRSSPIPLGGLAVLLASLPSVRGEEEPRVELPADWKPGERYQIELEKERINVRGKEQVRVYKGTTLIDVEVKEKNKKGYVFVWTYGESKLEGEAASEKAAPGRTALLKKLLELQKGFRLEMQTDESILPVALVNRETVLESWKRVMDETKRFATASGVPPAVLSSVEELSQPDSVVMSALKEARTFYLGCALALDEGVPSEYEDQLPNPFGGEPFPAKGYLLLKEVRRNTDEAVIQWSQEIEPVKAKAILLETMKKLAAGAGQPPPKDSELPAMKIDDSATFVMDLKTGWPKTVTSARTVTTSGQGRIDRMNFRRLVKEK